MSILNILFALASSLALFFTGYWFKDLTKEHDWAFNVAVLCLVALTLIFNYIKEKISERDPASKLYKTTKELNELKHSSKQNEENSKTEYDNEVSNIRSTHAIECTTLRAEIATLQGKLSVKDTIIHQIRNGITSNLIKHGSTPAFMEYVKDLAEKINSDFDVNTLAPVLTPETKKYIEMIR